MAAVAYLEIFIILNCSEAKDDEGCLFVLEIRES